MAGLRHRLARRSIHTAAQAGRTPPLTPPHDPEKRSQRPIPPDVPTMSCPSCPTAPTTAHELPENRPPSPPARHPRHRRRPLSHPRHHPSRPSPRSPPTLATNPVSLALPRMSRPSPCSFPSIQTARFASPTTFRPMHLRCGRCGLGQSAATIPRPCKRTHPVIEGDDEADKNNPLWIGNRNHAGPWPAPLTRILDNKPAPGRPRLRGWLTTTTTTKRPPGAPAYADWSTTKTGKMAGREGGGWVGTGWERLEDRG